MRLISGARRFYGMENLRRPLLLGPGFILLAVLVVTGCDRRASGRLPVDRLLDAPQRLEFLRSPFPELLRSEGLSSDKAWVERVRSRRARLFRGVVDDVYWDESPSHPMVLRFTKTPVHGREIGQRTAKVLLAPPGTVLRVGRKVGPGAVLDFGFGVLNQRFPIARGEIRFRILGRTSETGEPRTLFEASLRPGVRRGDRRWFDGRVDLKDYAGRTVWLTFETEEERRGSAAPSFLSAWINPAIVEPGEAEPPSVILISFDTLRADHLSCDGYPRPTSPRLDRLAAEGVLFRDVIAQAPYTLPSHMSMLTSLYPSFHGVNSPTKGDVLEDGVPTLADFFYRRGYRTWAVTGGGQVYHSFGFANGFETYVEYSERHGDVERKVRETVDFLKREAGRATFVFFHTYAVHVPYAPDPPHDRFFDPAYEGTINAELMTIEAINARKLDAGKKDIEHIVALYDGEIREADEAIGRLFDHLKEAGLDRKTLVVFTSDHGEEFMEHGKVGVHGHTLYDELLRVPLIFRWPGRLPSGVTVSGQVQSIDIMPTVLELVGLGTGGAILQGRVLDLQASEESQESGSSYAFSERIEADSTFLRCARGPRYKYVLDQDPKAGTTSALTFDLLRDSREQNGLLMPPGFEKAMRQRVRFLLDEAGRRMLAPARKKSRLDPKTIETLKALGYIR